MAKEWVLNFAFNRWQFNRPKYVGKLAESIRECSPKSLEEWESFYYEHVRPSGEMLGQDMKEHLKMVGRLLFTKISEQLKAEVEDITEEDCINYVREVVIERTFEGYVNEKKTVYEQLEHLLNVKLLPAPDIWDRRYNIDFYIPIGNKVIGIQIKPITYRQTPEIHKWEQWLRKSHERFEKEQDGKVFVIYSVTKKGGSKQILNMEVIDHIRKEISRLKRELEK